MSPANELPSHLSESQWSALMAEYDKSCLTQKQFCQQKGINLIDFRNSRCRIAYRKKKLQLKKLSTAKPPSFTEVKLQPSFKPKVLKLIHPNGIECSLPMSLSDIELVNFIRSLQSC